MMRRRVLTQMISLWTVIVMMIIGIDRFRVEAFHAENKGLNSIAAVMPLSNGLHRTGYHFQPLKHWINDPNAPMYYNGVYHLFYQYNPKGALWGNIVWAHSVSTDLISWQSLPPALTPTKPFDINGCWSGSATILPNNRPIILYTGLDVQSNQVQNSAYPSNLSDPYLRYWIKPDHNPLVVPGPDMNTTCFRDPTTAWLNTHRQGNPWEMAVGSRRKLRGMAYLYRSRDFRNWVRAKHPLHSVPNTGMWECVDFYPLLDKGEENGVDMTTTTSFSKRKYVMKVSLDLTRYDYYTIGKYDPVKDKYHPDRGMVDGWDGLRYDYGNFYASKSFFDPKKRRRILWGWANESDSEFNDVKKGWAGIQLIPRKVWLDPSGKQLLLWPVEELDSLRSDGFHMKNRKLKKGEVVELKGGVTAPQADVEVVFTLPKSLDKAEKFDPSWVNPMDLCGEKGSTVHGGIGPFGLLTLASKGLEEYTPVFFRVFKAQEKKKKKHKHVVLMCSDARRSTLTQDPCEKHHNVNKMRCMYKPSFGSFVDVDLSDRKLHLRTLIDHSVVESFAERGKTCITSRVYPKLAIYDKAHLFAFNNGTETIKIESLHAWSMRRPLHMNDPLP